MTKQGSILVRAIPALVLLAGLGVTALVCWNNISAARSLASTEFDRRAYFFASAIERSLRQSSAQSRNLASFMASSDLISADQFQRFVANNVVDRSSFYRAAWIKRLTSDQVEDFAKRLRAQNAPEYDAFSPYALDFTSSPPSKRPLAENSVHYIVAYAQAHSPLDPLLGFDWGSYDEDEDLFETADQTNGTVTSGILPGETALDETFHIAVFVSKLNAKDDVHSGYAAISIPVEWTILRGLEGFDWHDMAISISDGTTNLPIPHDTRNDLRPPQDLSPDGRFVEYVSIDVPGVNDWLLSFESTVATEGIPLAQTLLLMLFGFVAAMATALACRFLIRQNSLVRKRVIEQTSALMEANRDLQKQSASLDQLAKEAQLDRQAAIEANQAKSRFLASMSHELRTPLNAIIGFASIMRDEMFGPIGQPKYLDYAIDIQRSGQNLLSIVQDLLDIGKIESGRLKVDKSWIKVSDLLQETERTISAGPSAGDRHISFDVKATEEYLFADGRLIRQTLLNLLSNAVKFTRSGGRIQLCCYCDDAGALCLTVQDDGIGMDEHDLSRIFQPFVKLSSANDQNNDGVGLGLALVKSFVEANAGSISVESQVDQGTHIDLRFPANLVAIHPSQGEAAE